MFSLTTLREAFSHTAVTLNESYYKCKCTVQPCQYVQFSHASMSNMRTHMGHITEREHVTKKPTEMGNNFIPVNLNCEV